MAGGAVAGALLGAEVCAPLMLACWLLCCWPDDSSDDASSTGKHPKKPIVTHEWARRRSSGSGAGRGSAVSLHLPGPSGQAGCRLPLGGHRSHEELRGGAGSVIDEVLARRVWRSARDLTLEDEPNSPSLCPASPPPPRCKKHHSNTKHSTRDVTGDGSGDVMTVTNNSDVTPKFYIGSATSEPPSVLKEVIEQLQNKEEAIRCLYRAKEGKQWFNESLRGARSEHHSHPRSDRESRAYSRTFSRSGARHGTDTPDLPGNYPPASVEPAHYISRTEYLGQSPPPRTAPPAAATPPAGARHASDGDILASAPRPESGAFSESDVELSLRGATVPIPAPRGSPKHLPRETAI